MQLPVGRPGDGSGTELKPPALDSGPGFATFCLYDLERVI